MQFKLAFFTAALATLAAATPTPAPAGNTCSTGSMQCCNKVTSATDPAASKVWSGVLGLVLQDLNVDVGLTCSPVQAVGVGSSGCKSQAVCCQDNSHGGLVSIGCVPVQL